jgi:FAD:protein FMN transferase
MGEHERRFELFGTSVRILVGVPAPAGAPRPGLAAAAAEAVLRSCHRELTRFEAASELSRLNSDPAPSRVTSKLVAGAVAAALAAAERSGGLVDPTLLGAIVEAGYAESRVGAKPASLPAALREAPPRRPAAAVALPPDSAAPARHPAAPSPAAAWQAISVLGREVHRPPGVRLDLGGTAKGFAADRAAASLLGQRTFAVDAGGDIVLGGADQTPRRVTVAHPLDGGRSVEFELASGAVATSGLGTRIWRMDAGFAHHLLDPASGVPAWTGVIQATAIGATGVEAETLAKTALLSGPARGLAILEPVGGALVLDDGEVVLAGALREHATEAA